MRLEPIKNVKGNFNEVVETLKLKTAYRKIFGHNIDSTTFMDWYESADYNDELCSMERLLDSTGLTYCLLWDHDSDEFLVLTFKQPTIKNWKEFIDR